VELNGVHFPLDRLAEFARRHHVSRLALFGSILGPDFRPDSDIDLLVEFEPGRSPGMVGFGGMILELSDLLGRRVDLRTPSDLSPYFRSAVLKRARTLHAA
jgi:predicted nucleotidyltransferase